MGSVMSPPWPTQSAAGDLVLQIGYAYSTILAILPGNMELSIIQSRFRTHPGVGVTFELVGVDA